MARGITLLGGTFAMILAWAGFNPAQVENGPSALRAAEATPAAPVAQGSQHGEAKPPALAGKPPAGAPSPGKAQQSPRHATEPKAAKWAKPRSGSRLTSGKRHTILDVGPLHTGEKAILKALDEPAALEVTDKPLTALVDHIRQKHHIAVVLDKKALAEANIDPNTPVTAAITHILLCDALDLALHDAGLAWTIKSGALFITTTEEERSILINKCYNVADLVATTPDSPYKGDVLPAAARPATNNPTNDSSSRSRGVDLEPGAGGAICTGGFQVHLERNSGPDLDPVINLITTAVEPDSWDACGGPGTIASMSDLLVVRQTSRVHRKLEAFLAEIRGKRENGIMLAVEVQWLWLDAAQHEQLVGSAKPASTARSFGIVDARAQAELAAKVPGFRGQITCSNGQLVHLVSGDRHSVITGAIPVVGNGVAYQPLVERPNVGVVVELRASALPDADAAMLDVQSTVTRWGKERAPVQVGASWPRYQETTGSTKEGHVAQETIESPGGSASVAVDRPVMAAQQLATTVRVPLGKPVILGAMTFAPSGSAGLTEASEKPRQLYLIATTRIATFAAEGKKSRKP
jgi:hypothetical protein